MFEDSMTQIEEQVEKEFCEKDFDKVLLKFLLDEPFFATVVRSMVKTRTRDLPTAGVMYSNGTTQLFWNPDFLKSLTVKQIFGLLKHESYHLIFDHVTSRKQDPHILWNIATDLAINSLIQKDMLPECGLIPGERPEIKFKDESKVSTERMTKINKMADFIESLPKRMSSEWYMNEIKNNKAISKIMTEAYEGECVELDTHFDADLTEVEKKIAKARIKKILKEARKVGQQRGYGSLSREAKKLIDDCLVPEVDWKRALSYFCGTKQKTTKSKTYRRINKKYPYIHAGTRKRRTSNLAIYIDQSGSVSDGEVYKLFKALEKLSKTHTFTVYPFDYKVFEDKSFVWKKGKNSKFVRECEGGTNFEAVEDHYRKVSKSFDGYIVMTDGEAGKPKTCISKRCWIILPNRKLIFSPDKRDTVINMS